MSEVRSTLELDVSTALADIDALGAALTDTLTQASQAGSTAIADSVGATGPATQGITELGQASETTASQQGDLRNAVEGVAGVSMLATGQVGGMRTAVQGFGVDAIPAVAGALALTAGLKELFTAGVEAEGAAQRFTATLGNMAGRVSTINVGSLNADLKELSITLGSDDEATMQAAATLFQFATNAGIARGASADFTEQVIALAARAVALNPALGTIADVVPLMSRGLATGGRFAQRFQIDLTGAEISARALADRLPGVSGELSVTEKQMAGAALAAEKYGASLSDDVATGADNAIIKQRSLNEQFANIKEDLGRPLVAPVFDLMRAAIPAVEALGSVLSELGGAAIPLVTVAVQVLAPVLLAFAKGLEAIGPTVLTVVAGLFALAKAYALMVGVISASQGALSINPFVALAAVAVTLIGVFADTGDSADDLSSSVEDLGKKSDEALTKMAQALALRDVGPGLDDAEQKAVRTSLALEQLSTAAESNVATATRLGEAFLAAGLITQAQFTAVMDGAAAASRNLATDNRNAAASLTALVETAVGTLPTLGTALQTTKTQLDAFGVGLDSAATPEQFLANLQANLQAVTDFNFNISQLAGRGLTETAAALAAQGPEVGGKTAKAINDANPLMQIAIERGVAATRKTAERETAILARILGSKTKESFDGEAPKGFNAGEKMGSRYAAGLRSTADGAAAAGRAVARAAADGLKNAGSPTEHLFFDAGVSFVGALSAGLASNAASVNITAAGLAQGASAAATPSANNMAGTAPAQVQVIVVRDGWEASQHLPAGVGPEVEPWLGGSN